LIFHKRKAWQTVCVALALVILIVSSNTWVATSLVRSLEWKYLPQDKIPEADAIVVLGGGTVSAQSPRQTVEINGAGDRMIYAAHLYHEGKAPLLILSGGSITWLDGRQSSIAGEMKEILSALGVPDDAMVLQEKSQNTHEDAVYSNEVLREKGIKRIILVTSAMHMPRAVALFEHEGLEVIPAPTDFTVTEEDWNNLVSFNIQSQLIALIPSTGNISLTTNALKEYIGMMVYSLRGWL